MDRHAKRSVLVCNCCCREMRTRTSRAGFIAGMCRQCRTDSGPDHDAAIDVREELRSPAEDHDNTYNGGSEYDYNDGSTDFD
jgi:hypothetical protein